MANWVTLLVQEITHLKEISQYGFYLTSTKCSNEIIMLVVTANSAPGGYGAQFSEISVYEIILISL